MMPRRHSEHTSDDGPPRKRNCSGPDMSLFDFNLKLKEFFKDLTGKQWKLGKAVGLGGFGQIYLASDNLMKEVNTDCNYVAKVENHKNGPLFVEINCYLRIAKPSMIDEWKKQKKMSCLGMPHYVASGSHARCDEKYRFLILQRFGDDLEKILQNKRILNLKTALMISMQIIDVLEYIHSKGYIHSDIKASNILLSEEKICNDKPKVTRSTYEKQSCLYPVRSCRAPRVPKPNLRTLRPPAHVNYLDDIPDFEFEEILSMGYDNETELKKCGPKQDQVYLLDYGLACKYLTSNGEHKPFCADERKAHAGTIIFCSRDAHKGAPSRRSDLESLGYNIIYWLTGNLPWSEDVEYPELVAKKKQNAMTDVEYFLRSCFNEYAEVLDDYFRYLLSLEFQEKPDYSYCKKLFRQAIRNYGYKDDSCFDFDNLESTFKRVKEKKKVSENMKLPKIRIKPHKIKRPPLQSNIPVKPLLRKKAKNKAKCKTKWFRHLADPETILKQAREKKNVDNNDFVNNTADLDISGLNPTYAMIEVYNKCQERPNASPTYKGDGSLKNVDGYTPAMMSVLYKIQQRKDLDCEKVAVNFADAQSGRAVKKCFGKRKRKYESPAKPRLRKKIAKSTTALKKGELQGRKVKSCVLRRSYSLRG